MKTSILFFILLLPVAITLIAGLTCIIICVGPFYFLFKTITAFAKKPEKEKKESPNMAKIVQSMLSGSTAEKVAGGASLVSFIAEQRAKTKSQRDEYLNSDGSWRK